MSPWLTLLRVFLLCLCAIIYVDYHAQLPLLSPSENLLISEMIVFYPALFCTTWNTNWLRIGTYVLGDFHVNCTKNIGQDSRMHCQETLVE